MMLHGEQAAPSAAALLIQNLKSAVQNHTPPRRLPGSSRRRTPPGAGTAPARPARAGRGSRRASGAGSAVAPAGRLRRPPAGAARLKPTPAAAAAPPAAAPPP